MVKISFMRDHRTFPSSARFDTISLIHEEKQRSGNTESQSNRNQVVAARSGGPLGEGAGPTNRAGIGQSIAVRIDPAMVLEHAAAEPTPRVSQPLGRCVVERPIPHDDQPLRRCFHAAFHPALKMASRSGSGSVPFHVAMISAS